MLLQDDSEVIYVLMMSSMFVVLKSPILSGTNFSRMPWIVDEADYLLTDRDNAYCIAIHMTSQSQQKEDGLNCLTHWHLWDVAVILLFYTHHIE